MYEQICDILKQNRIPYKDFIWIDEFGNLQLNNNEEWIEYIEDSVDQDILMYFIEDNTKYYKIINRIVLGSITIFILNEVSKNENNGN